MTQKPGADLQPLAPATPQKVLEVDLKMAMPPSGESTNHVTIKEEDVGMEEWGEDKAIKMEEEEPVPPLNHIKTEDEAPTARQGLYRFQRSDDPEAQCRPSTSRTSHAQKVLEADKKMAVPPSGESTNLRENNVTVKEEDVGMEERGEDKAIKMEKEEPVPPLSRIKTEDEAPTARQDGQPLLNDSKNSPIFSQDVQNKEDLPSGFSQATPTTASDPSLFNPITPNLNLVLLSVSFSSDTAPSTSQKFPCQTCEKCFTQKDYLTKHQEKHAPKSYWCSDCGECFQDVKLLEEHKNTHDDEGPHVCSVCGKDFPRGSDLVHHRRYHTDDQPYCCPECGKSFSWRTHLLKHQRCHEERPFPCSECGKSFHYNRALNEHYRIHTGEKPYSCSECGKLFTSEPRLRSHFRTHTGEKPFSCSECGKSFSCRSALSKHHNTHTGEKRYSCSECEKSFSVKASLVVHQRIHTGEKPYLCSECHQRFSDRTALSRHRKLCRAGKKPLSCS